MALTGAQYQELNDALVDAFPAQASLVMMLKFRLGKALATIVAPGTLTYEVFQLIGVAEAEGWTRDLVVAARQSVPRNERLFLAAQNLGLATPAPQKPELEKIISDTHSFLDIAAWRESLVAIEAQVCRVRVRTNKGTVHGTGFLLGPDVVMTNHHVVEAVILGEQGGATADGLSAKAADVICQFDYKRASGYVNPGVEFRLSPAAWLVDSSPASAVDLAPEPKPSAPGLDELDYALLRLAEPAGDRPVGPKPEPGAPTRGWIHAPKTSYDFAPRTAVFIVQHPDGEPLSLALDTSGVLGENANRTRVKYTTNTLGGSSGSPCFNADWQLVALHHSGDPNFNTSQKPAYNEGIPMAAIRALLKARNLESVLDSSA